MRDWLRAVVIVSILGTACTDDSATHDSGGRDSAIVDRFDARADGLRDRIDGVMDQSNEAASTEHPHEPIGFAPITDRRFDALEEDGWLHTDTGMFSIVTDDAAPRSPSNVGQALFPAGFGSGSGPMNTYLENFGGAGARIYIHFWVKISSNWDGNDSSINKILFIWINDGPRVYLQALGRGAASLHPRVNTQSPGMDYSLGNDSVELTRGEWHEWEVVMRRNTASGGGDSSVQAWFDGAQIVDFQGDATSALTLWDGGNDTFHTVSWNPTYGGLGEPVPAGQHQWIDHLYVSSGPL